MNVACLTAEYIYELNKELEEFNETHDVISVLYRIYSEFCAAEIHYN